MTEITGRENMEETVVEGISKRKEPIGRNFRMVVLNSSLSTFGSAGFGVAILWLTLIITKSPVISGVADGMGALPMLFSFVAGAYIDRLPSKKRFALAISVARVLSIPALFVAEYSASLFLETAAIYIVAFMIGLGTDIINSTGSSWTKQFLSESQYTRGSSLMQSATAFAQSLSFVAAGVIILFGLQFTILSFSAIFAISAIPILFIRGDRLEIPPSESSMQSSLMNGVKYLFRDSRLRAVVILSLAVNLAFGAVGIFFAVLVEQQFALSAIYFTLLFAALTAGIVVGSVLGSMAKGKIGGYAITTILAIGISMALFGQIGNIYLDYPVSAFIGLMIGLVNVVLMSAMMKIVDQEMMARVMGGIKTFAVSLTFLSGAIGGILIRLFTLSGAFMVIGIILVATSAVPVFFRDFYRTTV